MVFRVSRTPWYSSLSPFLRCEECFTRRDVIDAAPQITLCNSSDVHNNLSKLDKNVSHPYLSHWGLISAESQCNSSLNVPCVELSMCLCVDIDSFESGHQYKYLVHIWRKIYLFTHIMHSLNYGRRASSVIWDLCLSPVRRWGNRSQVTEGPVLGSFSYIRQSWDFFTFYKQWQAGWYLHPCEVEAYGAANHMDAKFCGGTWPLTILAKTW
jgi:hypothetical protein